MLRTRWIVSVCFFLSGIAALIYEVVWAKQLALLFGNTAQAHTIVLATFMGGLAAGYDYFGKAADKSGANPLRLYAWMEIVIGLLGALSIPLLPWLDFICFWIGGYLGPASPMAAALKLILSVLFIFPATFFMGGTLPVLTRFSIGSLRDVEVEVGWLYFLNSLGAGCGSLLAGFLLIPTYGLNLSTIEAAFLNVTVGVVAWVLQKRRDRLLESDLEVGEDKGPQRLYSRLQVRLIVFGIGISGAAALLYETAWIRLLALVLGSSTHAFSLMLAAFITGIALGGLAVSRSWIPRGNALMAFVAAELAVALSIFDPAAL